jgi:putative SOS response-associated peptidase YedK
MIAERRCLIPVTAWAEAEGEKGSMTRTWYSLHGEEVWGHTTTIDPLKLHRKTMTTRRVWSDLKDNERAMRCDKRKAKHCKLVRVERF